MSPAWFDASQAFLEPRLVPPSRGFFMLRFYKPAGADRIGDRARVQKIIRGCDPLLRVIFLVLRCAQPLVQNLLQRLATFTAVR